MKKLCSLILSLVILSLILFSCQKEPCEHTYSNQWSSNKTEHWHAATCEHSSEVINKAKHTWNHTEYKYDAEFGKNIRVCNVCFYVDIKDHIHTEDSGKVTTEPDCVTKGVRTYMCTVCNAVARTEEVDAKGHTEDSGKVTTEPGCLTKGEKTYKCSVCDAELRTEEVAATGHIEECVIIKEATISSAGVKEYKCKQGDYIFRKELYCGPSEVYEEKVEYKDYYENTINTSFYYIYFGVFPKSAKASSVTVDADEIITMGVNTYYHGSDDEWYAKLDTKYFKVEPIKWKVLTTDYAETGKVLLLSEYVLNSNVPFYFNPGAGQRIIDGKTIYDNNYKYSTIRAYLNGKYENYDTQSTDYKDKGFLQTAFGVIDQSKIIETEVNNGYETTGYTGDDEDFDYSKYYTSEYACDNTTDKVFLLSRSELYNVYGFSKEDDGYARIRKVTDYAKANNYQSGWWTRSPSGVDDYDAHYVSDWGSIGSINTVYTYWYGVVPAMWINLK